MFHLHTVRTANGDRASIALEAAELPHRTSLYKLPLDAASKENIRALHLYARFPLLEFPDPDRAGLSQSGAILLFSAQVSGRLIPSSPSRAALAMQWLMFTLTDVQAASAAYYHSTHTLASKAVDAAAFFGSRLTQFLDLCDEQLSTQEFVAEELSVADIALFPTIWHRRQTLDAGLAGLHRWLALMSRQPFVSGTFQKLDRLTSGNDGASN
jgi:GST-like protein